MGLRVLVSGFEPFASNKENPSAVLLEDLNKVTSPFIIKTVLLPVTFSKSFQILKEHIENFRPQVVLSFGLAADREAISLEAQAKNFIHCKIPDNEGVIVIDQKISESGESILTSSYHIDQIINKLAPSFSNLQKSLDAGDYVCNYLYYQLLDIGKAQGFQTLFIHLPQTIELNPNSKFTRQDYLAFALNLIEVLAEPNHQL